MSRKQRHDNEHNDIQHNDTWHYDIQHNDVQYNETQRSNKNCNTQHNGGKFLSLCHAMSMALPNNSYCFLWCH
jgi:hypothetical protein